MILRHKDENKMIRRQAQNPKNKMILRHKDENKMIRRQARTSTTR